MTTTIHMTDKKLIQLFYAAKNFWIAMHPPHTPPPTHPNNKHTQGVK